MKSSAVFLGIVSVISFGVLVEAWAPGSVESCPPGPAPTCPHNPIDDYDNLFNHPSDCHYFIHCDAGEQPICKECPADLHFNPVLHVCDWPDSAGCSNGGGGEITPAPTEKPEVTKPPTEKPDECTEEPEEECPVCDCDGVRHPHPIECEWYYECKNGVPRPVHCDDGLHFNPSIGICDYPCLAGCKPQPPPVTTPKPTTPKPTTPKPTTPKPTTPKPTTPKPTTPKPTTPKPTTPKPTTPKPTTPKPTTPKPTTPKPTTPKPTTPKPTTPKPTTPKPTTPKPTTIKPTDPPPIGDCPSTNGIPVPECPFPDPEFSVFFPHPTDCHWFYHCSNGVAYCKECPADLHWNVVLETCDYPENAGCENKLYAQKKHSRIVHW